MTLRRQTDSSTESSSGSSSDSSSSTGSSSSSGSQSSSSDSDSSTSESPKPREEGGAAAGAVVAPAAPPVASVRPPDPEPERKAPPPPPQPPPPPRRRSSASTKPKSAPPQPPRRAKTPARQNGARTPAPKPPAKARASSTPCSDRADAKKPAKKKSIFSPDNSSEDERDRNGAAKSAVKPSAKPNATTTAKRKGRKPNVSTSSNDRTKNDRPKSTAPKENDTVARRKKRPGPKKPPPAEKSENDKNGKFRSKETVSSCSSTDANSSASTSWSDSESSVVSCSVTTTPKKAAIVTAKLNRAKSSKVEPVKTEKNTSSKIFKENPAPVCTDSDVENTKPLNNSSNVTRKLTRSASTRKSKHIVGKNVNSDTESETEHGPTKKSISKSPVKRATISSKGPSALLCPVKGRSGSLGSSLSGIGTGAVSRSGQTNNSSPHESLPEKELELRCMLPGCDSLGHLSGRLDRHFTIEACPMYHNSTADECRQQAVLREELHEIRRQAQHALDARRTSQPSIEHRAYQLKVKEMRSKWKPPSSSSGDVKQGKLEGSCKNSWSSQQENEAEGEREPVLTGFVPDYDLRLFREAQAAAAFKIEEELKNVPPTKGIRYVCMGEYRMKALYQSPYPPDVARLPQIYICQFCLIHHKTVTGINRHRKKCIWRHPPGDEVYRKGDLGVWEVDGRRQKQYCQQLCLLAKFFLDHKTLYYDVEPFLFYVMTVADSDGCQTVGYFSKEKNSLQNYNVSCILTLPPYQRKGYGRMLIDFSYLLTRVEGKIGSPEKPLSDLGLISYRSYWKDVLLQYLCNHSGSTLSIRDLSQSLAINSYDIVSTLQALGMMKYWKGKHIILKRQDILDEYIERTKQRGPKKQIDPSYLKWTPFVPP